MAQGLRCRRLDGPRFPHILLSPSLTGPDRLIQGGGILAAFTSFFPDLVDNKIVLIAPTGLVEVSLSIFCTQCAIALRPTSSPGTCQKQLNLCRLLSFNL